MKKISIIVALIAVLVPNFVFADHDHDHHDHHHDHEFHHHHVHDYDFDNLDEVQSIYSDTKFSSIGLVFDAELNSGMIEAFTRYKEGTEWSDWYAIHVEDVQFDVEDDPIAFFAFNPTNEVEYIVEPLGDAEVHSVKHELFYPDDITVKAKNEFAILGSVSDIVASSSTPKLITREGWGADESLRVWTGDEPPEFERDWGEAGELYPDEFELENVIYNDVNGDYLTWPIEYSESIEKIVVHHTATTSNLDNPEQAIRNIYQFHAVNRGWGDIGYNYIIDTEGNIYEGRYGGEKVVGAHSGIYNVGTIGISVLGNYDEMEVSDEVIESLNWIISEKVIRHDINPTAISKFRGEDLENIVGHRDVNPTACPGDNLYDELGTLRSLASKNYKNQDPSDEDYDFLEVSDGEFFRFEPNSTNTVKITLKNNGQEDWEKGDVKLVTGYDLNKSGKITFNDGDPFEPIAILDEDTDSGDTAEFEIVINADEATGLYVFYIEVSFNDRFPVSKYIALPVVVQDLTFEYTIEDFEKPSSLMIGSRLYSGKLTVKNTGDLPWENEGVSKVMLGTDFPQDRKSPFYNDKISQRVSRMAEDRVEPGETGTFYIFPRAPKEEGNYREYYRIVNQNNTWFTGPFIFFGTEVTNEPINGIASNLPTNNKYLKNQGRDIEFNLKNIGSYFWTDKNFSIGTLKSKDLKILEDFERDLKTVKPGDETVISGRIQTPDKEGVYNLLLFPRIGTQTITGDPIAFKMYVSEDGSFDIDNIDLDEEEFVDEEEEVVIEPDPVDLVVPEIEELDEPETEKGTLVRENTDIRVLISGIDFDPVISSNGDFEVFSNGESIGSFEEDDLVAVTYEDGKYVIDEEEYDSHITFVPSDEDSILRVDNYNHPPAFSDDFNDNEYRGDLEVRYDEDRGLVVINELPLESYMLGLGETLQTDPIEKQKAIMILARSYAKYYIDLDYKFPGKPWDLDDDPAVSQKYLGYGLEKRSIITGSVVEETAGLMVTYEGEVIKTPYFSQSDGRTRSAEEVWGWTHTPYLISVDDPWCEGLEQLGHGVGVSGCGAKGMAEAGSTAEEIIKYYVQGVEIEKIY